MYRLFVLSFLIAWSVLHAQGTRLSLTTMRVEGYSPYKNIHSFLDVGLERDPDTGQCRFLGPRPSTRASGEAWQPFDFYTNVAPKEQQEYDRGGLLGEPDIFFVGDDNNRNAAKDPHTLTRLVADNFRGSLDFLEPQVDLDSFSFLVRFIRGKVKYQTLIRARTWDLDDNQCQAAIFQCTQTYERPEDGVTLCHPEGWTRQLLEIIAIADYAGASSDYAFGVKDEKKKNDVKAIEGAFQNLDRGGRPTGSRYRERVASK